MLDQQIVKYLINTDFYCCLRGQHKENMTSWLKNFNFLYMLFSSRCGLLSWSKPYSKALRLYKYIPWSPKHSYNGLDFPFYFLWCYQSCTCYVLNHEHVLIWGTMHLLDRVKNPIVWQLKEPCAYSRHFLDPTYNKNVAKILNIQK